VSKAMMENMTFTGEPLYLILGISQLLFSLNPGIVFPLSGK
jgi:hypothetical protein